MLVPLAETGFLCSQDLPRRSHMGAGVTAAPTPHTQPGLQARTAAPPGERSGLPAPSPRCTVSCPCAHVPGHVRGPPAQLGGSVRARLPSLESIAFPISFTLTAAAARRSLGLQTWMKVLRAEPSGRRSWSPADPSSGPQQARPARRQRSLRFPCLPEEKCILKKSLTTYFGFWS